MSEYLWRSVPSIDGGGGVVTLYFNSRNHSRIDDLPAGLPFNITTCLDIHSYESAAN